MQIHGFSGLTLLDYPGRLAATVFCGSCNFRCPFCHNSSLVLCPSSLPAIPAEEVLDKLRKRASSLEGVCVTGGEPTLQADLPDFIRAIREYTGLAVKLDTNGSRPDVIEELVGDGLVDFIAMDIKASPDGYARATGLPSFSMDEIFRSVDFIRSCGIDYEFRTTVVSGLHTAEDFRQTGQWLKGVRSYALQMYKDSGELIAPEGLSAPTREELISYRDILLPFVPSAFIRGIDL